MKKYPTSTRFGRSAFSVSGILLAGSFALTSCSGSSEGGNSGEVSAGSGCSETYSIAFSHPAGDVAAVKAIKGFVSERAKENGCVELLLDSTVGNNLETQRKTLENWVSQEVDAIVVWPVDDKAVDGLRVQAQNAGTKWLTYAAPIPEQDGSVGFDNDQAGKDMANLLESWLDENYPGRNVTAMVTTATALPALKGRSDHVLEKLDELGVEVVSKQDCIVPECGMQIAEDVLHKNSDAKIFVGLNDDAGVGALRAIQNSGNDPEEYFVAGYDGSEESLTSLRDGTGYTVSAAIPLRDLGYSIIDNSIAAITGEGDANNLTPMKVLTADDEKEVETLLEAFDGNGSKK